MARSVLNYVGSIILNAQESAQNFLRWNDQEKIFVLIILSNFWKFGLKTSLEIEISQKLVEKVSRTDPSKLFDF